MPEDQAAGAPIELRYELQIEDLMAISEGIEQRQKPELRKALHWGFIILCPVMTIFCIYMTFWQGVDLNWGIYFFPGLLVALAILRFLVRPWSHKRHYRKLGLTGKEFLTKFGTNKVQSAGSGVSGDYEWSSFEDVSKTETHLMLWLNHVQALVVPLRAVPDAATKETLLSLVRLKTGVTI